MAAIAAGPTRAATRRVATVGAGVRDGVVLVTLGMVAREALAHPGRLGHYVRTTEELLSRVAEGPAR